MPAGKKQNVRAESSNRAPEEWAAAHTINFSRISALTGSRARATEAKIDGDAKKPYVR
jgi:hypothetical protein